MILPGVRAGAIGGEDSGLHSELLGDKSHRFGRGRAEVVWDKAHEAQGAQLQSIAKAVVGRPGAWHMLQIMLRERKKCDEVLRHDDLGKAIAPGPFGLGEKLDRHGHLRVDGNLRLAPRIAWKKMTGCILA